MCGIDTRTPIGKAMAHMAVVFADTTPRTACPELWPGYLSQSLEELARQPLSGATTFLFAIGTAINARMIMSAQRSHSAVTARAHCEMRPHGIKRKGVNY